VDSPVDRGRMPISWPTATHEKVALVLKEERALNAAPCRVLRVFSRVDNARCRPVANRRQLSKIISAVYPNARASHLTDFQHHAHQVRERRRLHLLHHARAVDFHGALTELQIAGNHLVRFSVHHQIEHFALTRGQRF